MARSSFHINISFKYKYVDIWVYIYIYLYVYIYIYIHIPAFVAGWARIVFPSLLAINFHITHECPSPAFKRSRLSRGRSYLFIKFLKGLIRPPLNEWSLRQQRVPGIAFHHLLFPHILPIGPPFG